MFGLQNRDLENSLSTTHLSKLKVNIVLEDSFDSFSDTTSPNLQRTNIDMYKLNVVGIHQYSIFT